MTLTDVKLGDLIAQLEVLKPYNFGGGCVRKFQSFYALERNFCECHRAVEGAPKTSGKIRPYRLSPHSSQGPAPDP